MFTLIKILFILSAVLVIAGFTTSTFGLVRSFMLDRLNRFVYLGLSAIGIGVLIAGLAFGISYLQVRAAFNDAFSNEPVASDTYTEEPTANEETDFVEGDNDVTDPDSLGSYGPYPEEFIPAVYTTTNGELECVPSVEAGNFIAPFYMEPQSVLPDGTYVVAESDTTGYIVSDTPYGLSLVYVDTESYQISAANEVAYDNTALLYPEDEGYGPIDTGSETYQVAEGCTT